MKNTEKDRHIKKRLAFFYVVIIILCIPQSLFSKTIPQLASPGTSGIIDYSRFGTFENIGTSKYVYRISDRRGLMLASGEGVYPDWKSVYQDPLYRMAKAEGRLQGHHWAHVDSSDPIADFFVWATAQEEYGVKQFFIAQALEEAGFFLQAVKAYYAVVIFSPRSPCWSADKSFVWYVGPEAIQRIKSILQKHPELHLQLVDAEISVTNGEDTNLSNDVIVVNPGKLVELKEISKPITQSPQTIIARRGTGRTQLLKYKNGHWQFAVSGVPFIIKGVTYNPTKIGEGPESVSTWMFEDTNADSIIDSPYESWVDINGDNKQEKNEPAVGDFALLRDMGCNAIRYYHIPDTSGYNPNTINKKLLRDLYQRYGIRVIMGDFLGAYTHGSQADWHEGTDYTDPEQKALMKKSVKDMIIDLKDEPFVLLWLLGNENNMPSDFTGVNATRTNASAEPKAYAEFLNDVIRMIHRLDTDRPVAVGNLEIHLLEYYAKYAPEIDILAINSYRGKRGFGSLWYSVKKVFDRPVLVLEYGCDAYRETVGIDEEAQKEYHKGCWYDIAENSFNQQGSGNAVGGVIFEWMDEWWKDTHSGDPQDQQQIKAQNQMPFPDGWSHEEWLGITGQGDGSKSPFLRQLRKTYFFYKDVWNK